MSKLSEKLKQLKESKTIVAYHGSNVAIKKFDRNFSAQGVFWFSEDKDKILKGESGATSINYIMKVQLTVKNIAGWDEYDKYSIDELINKGFDSIKLDDDWVIFDNKNIKILSTEKVENNKKGSNMSKLSEKLKAVTEATIKKGSVVLVTNLDDLNAKEWNMSNREYTNLIAHNNKTAMVQSIDVDDGSNTEENFYTVKFDDGYEIEAISGVYLKKATPKDGIPGKLSFTEVVELLTKALAREGLKVDVSGTSIEIVSKSNTLLATLQHRIG